MEHEEVKSKLLEALVLVENVNKTLDELEIKHIKAQFEKDLRNMSLDHMNQTLHILEMDKQGKCKPYSDY